MHINALQYLPDAILRVLPGCTQVHQPHGSHNYRFGGMVRSERANLLVRMSHGTDVVLQYPTVYNESAACY